MRRAARRLQPARVQRDVAVRVRRGGSSGEASGSTSSSIAPDVPASMRARDGFARVARRLQSSLCGRFHASRERPASGPAGGSAGAAALAAPDCARPPRRQRPRPWRLMVNKRVSASTDALSSLTARRGVGHTASRLRSRAALDRPGRPTPTAIGPRPARPLDGAPGRRTRATVATSTHARGQRGVRRAPCRRLPWYRQPRDRSSAAPRRSPIPSSASVVLSARAMPKRRARSRVARRTCIICKITHETHGTCSKHRLQRSPERRPRATSPRDPQAPSSSYPAPRDGSGHYQ